MSFSPTTESRLALAAHSNSTCYSELVLGMQGLVRSMVNGQLNGNARNYHLKQELESEGRLALCESAVEYRGQGRFSTFAGRRITRAMVSYLRTASGIGTEWGARKQQAARRERWSLTKIFDEANVLDDEIFGGAPDRAELAYVHGSDDLARLADEQISTVGIEDAGLAVAPEVDDGAEQRFYDRWISLSTAQMVLVEQAELLGTASGGTSLTRLAAVVGDRRDRVERRLAEALTLLVL